MVGLPGTPAIQNIMPTETLGTTAYAAPLNGIIVSIIIFVLSILWLEWNDRQLKSRGIGFVPGPKDDPDAIDISDRTGLPSFAAAIFPIIFVVAYIFVLQQILKVKWDTNYISSRRWRWAASSPSPCSTRRSPASRTPLTTLPPTA